jgi:hypothetical protein
MNFPTELDIECPDCGVVNLVPETSMAGVYQGYCGNPQCGGWIDYNFEEALASEEAERQMDAKRDERYER